jgi:hypothetical protein
MANVKNARTVTTEGRVPTWPIRDGRIERCPNDRDIKQLIDIGQTPYMIQMAEC